MRKDACVKHSIDLLFPITLFLVMTLSAFVLLSIAANTYQNITEHSYRNQQSRIALSYIREKIRQHENPGAIRLQGFDGLETLVIEEALEDATYCTCLYFYEGTLRELFFKEGVVVSPSDGKVILTLSKVSMEIAADGLLYVQCTDLDGQIADSYISIPREADAPAEEKEAS